MSSNLLRVSKRDEVGSSKYMTTDAILYRDGTLAIDVYTENKNPFSGLRGRVIVVARNANGEAIAMSQTFRCTTRGGVLDIFCQSSGRDKFIEDLGEQIGADAVGLDIVQQDEFMGNGVNFEKIATVAEQVRLTSAVSSWLSSQCECTGTRLIALPSRTSVCRFVTYGLIHVPCLWLPNILFWDNPCLSCYIETIFVYIWYWFYDRSVIEHGQLWVLRSTPKYIWKGMKSTQHLHAYVYNISKVHRAVQPNRMIHIHQTVQMLANHEMHSRCINRALLYATCDN